MPLLNITGTNCFNKNFHVGFGLASGEAQGDFQWHLNCLESLRTRYEIGTPKVILSDFDRGFKNAVMQTWPTARQQLCVWHVLKNVAFHVKKKWIQPHNVSEEILKPVDENIQVGPNSIIQDNDAGPDVHDDAEHDEDSDDEIVDEDETAGWNATQALRHGISHAEKVIVRGESELSAEKRVWEDTQEDFLKAFKAVVYADEEDGYKRLWEQLKKEFARQTRKSYLHCQLKPSWYGAVPDLSCFSSHQLPPETLLALAPTVLPIRHQIQPQLR